MAGVGRRGEAPSPNTGEIGNPSIGWHTELIMNKDEGKPACVAKARGVISHPGFGGASCERGKRRVLVPQGVDLLVSVAL